MDQLDGYNSSSLDINTLTLSTLSLRRSGFSRCDDSDSDGGDTTPSKLNTGMPRYFSIRHAEGPRLDGCFHILSFGLPIRTAGDEHKYLVTKGMPGTDSKSASFGIFPYVIWSPEGKILHVQTEVEVGRFFGGDSDGDSVWMSGRDREQLYVVQLRGSSPQSRKYRIFLLQPHSGLSHSFPSLLTCLEDVKAVDLSESDLEGKLPNFVARRRELQILHLDHNHLRGNIRSWIGAMSDLTHLDLSHNDLQGGIPDSFQHLALLRVLNLSHNKLDGALKQFIWRSLGRLETLDLSHNQFRGRFSKQLETRNLTKLNLSHNKLEGEIPESIGEIASLVTLNLSHNCFSGTLPSFSSGALVKLQKLDLSHNQLDGAIPLAYGNLRSLKALNLEHNMLRGALPSTFKNLHRVTTIKLDGNHLKETLDDNCIEPIIRMEKLRNDLLEDDALLRDWDPRHPDTTSSEPFPKSVILLGYEPYWFCDNHTLSVCSRPLVRFNFMKNKLLKFLRRLLEVENPHILQCLLNLYKSFSMAAEKRKSTMREELMLYAFIFGDMMIEITRCDSFDNDDVVFKFLQSSDFVSHEVGFEKYWDVADLFMKSEFMYDCMSSGFKPLFGTPQVRLVIHRLVCGHCIFGGGIDPYDLTGQQIEEYASHIPFEVRRVLDAFSSPRSCPLLMFLLEGLSKLVLVFLIAHILTKPEKCYFQGSSEDALILMLVTGVAYELGQAMAAVRKLGIKDYTHRAWNMLDCVMYAMCAAWVVSYLTCANLIAGRIFLAVAVIPASFGLLQYVSFIPSFGVLVIMTFAMVKDLLDFAVVFFLCLLGFGISFLGIFRSTDSEGYSTYLGTFLTLFSASFGEFDFGAFDSHVLSYEVLGKIIMFAMLCLLAIVLFNILIARMTTTYEEVERQSFAEWSFFMAEVTDQYLLHFEDNPLNMLPPPLNAIPIIVSPLHYLYMPRKQVSIAGTVSNFILRILFAVPREFLFVLVFVVKVYSRLQKVVRSGNEKTKTVKHQARFHIFIMLWLLRSPFALLWYVFGWIVGRAGSSLVTFIAYEFDAVSNSARTHVVNCRSDYKLSHKLPPSPIQASLDSLHGGAKTALGLMLNISNTTSNDMPIFSKKDICRILSAFEKQVTANDDEDDSKIRNHLSGPPISDFRSALGRSNSSRLHLQRQWISDIPVPGGGKRDSWGGIKEDFSSLQQALDEQQASQESVLAELAETLQESQDSQQQVIRELLALVQSQQAEENRMRAEQESLKTCMTEILATQKHQFDTLVSLLAVQSKDEFQEMTHEKKSILLRPAGHDRKSPALLPESSTTQDHDI